MMKKKRAQVRIRRIKDIATGVFCLVFVPFGFVNACIYIFGGERARAWHTYWFTTKMIMLAAVFLMLLSDYVFKKKDASEKDRLKS